MNMTILEYLNELLKKTRIRELTIEHGGTKIYINRTPKKIEDKPKEKKTAEVPKESKPVQPEEKRYILKSNSVGIFYRGKTKLAPHWLN